MKKFLLALVAVFGMATSAMALDEGCRPCSVDSVSFHWVVEGGKNNLEISFVTPTAMIDQYWCEQEMTDEITRIDIKRGLATDYNLQVITTIESPAKGTKYSYTDCDLELGTYSYEIVVYVGDVYDWSAVNTAYVGEIPGSFDYDAFVIESAETDPNTLVFKLLLPAVNSLGEPMTMPFTKLELKEMNMMTYQEMEVATITDSEALVAGEVFTYVIENVADGNHYYTAQLFTETGGNYMTYCMLYVGADAPGMVENIAVEKSAAGYTVSWEAPSKSMNGGDMGDVTEFTYTVLRGADEYDLNADTIAVDTKELSIVDNKEFTEETKFCYIITAKNSFGEGLPALSKTLVDGPAATLPYTENFDVELDNWGNTTYEHNSWTQGYNGYYCAWQLGQSVYVNYELSVSPHNGKGLIYAYYSPWTTYSGSWDNITSGHVNFEDADAPQLSFWLFDLASIPSDAEVNLTVLVSTDDENFTPVYKHSMGHAQEDAWQEIKVDLDILKDAPCASVRFQSDAEGYGCVPVSIDEISIIADKNASAIQTVEVEKASGIFNLEGMRAQRVQSGVQIVNGKVIFVK